MKTIALSLITVILVSCGSKDDTGSDVSSEVTAKSEEEPAEVKVEPAPEPAPMMSMYVSEYESLQECTSEIERQLVFVSDQENFYHCKSGEWKSVDAFNNPKSIVKDRWVFRDETDDTANEINEESGTSVWVNDINLVRFVDGSGILTISGSMLELSWNIDMTYYTDWSEFSETFFLKPTDQEVTYTSKITYGDNNVLVAKVSNMVTYNPQLLLDVSTDGNLTNNTAVEFDMIVLERD